MEKLIIAKQLLESILSIPVTLGFDGLFDSYSFEQMHCFIPEYQRAITASYLNSLIPSLNQKMIYELHEPLQMHILFFYVQNTLVVIGPFCETNWDDQTAEDSLIDLSIPFTYFTDYKFYRCRYQVVDSQIVLRTAKRFLTAIETDASQYGYYKISKSIDTTLKSIVIKREHHFESVNQRYLIETEFENAIREGNADEAISALERLNKIPHEYAYLSLDMHVSITGNSILRTLSRVAAKQAGLPPVIIDSICQEYAQKLYSLKQNDGHKQARSLTKEMITVLCQEIRKYKRQPYSPTVRRVVHYIQLNLSHTLTASSIAKEFHLSPNYLSRQVKKESGLPITRLIIQERTKKAALLLSTTAHTIQDISNYVGYADNNYFTKIFKAQYGHTPTEYREKYTL